MTDELKAKIAKLQKDAKFLAELNAAVTPEARKAVWAKYGIDSSELPPPPKELDEDELDKVAGGVEKDPDEGKPVWFDKNPKKRKI